MIAFATLFLGLVLGVQDVELTVGSEVAAVEVRLGERVLAVLRGEPWKLKVDFGPELVPQKLVAVARDAEGEEIGRVLQWINLPQPPAEVTVALDGEAAGRVARLAWESLVADEPERVAVSLDGAPLAVEDPRRIELPPHEESQLHFLHAELDFPGHTSAVAEMTFGGTVADLPSQHYVRFVWPDFQPREGFRRSYDLFPVSPDFEPRDGGIFFLLYQAAVGGKAVPAPRLADAVAVAGLEAAGERRRRVVVLVLGAAVAVDPSQLTVQQTRRYLERLGVPFEVWSLTGDTEAAAWGEVRDASTLGKLSGAVKDLSARLKRQAIVWVDGVHLPQEIALTPVAEEAGLALAR